MKRGGTEGLSGFAAEAGSRPAGELLFLPATRAHWGMCGQDEGMD